MIKLEDHREKYDG